jgi:hypothetical protein
MEVDGMFFSLLSICSCEANQMKLSGLKTDRRNPWDFSGDDEVITRQKTANLAGDLTEYASLLDRQNLFGANRPLLWFLTDPFQRHLVRLCDRWTDDELGAEVVEELAAKLDPANQGKSKILMRALRQFALMASLTGVVKGQHDSQPVDYSLSLWRPRAKSANCTVFLCSDKHEFAFDCYDIDTLKAFRHPLAVPLAQAGALNIHVESTDAAHIPRVDWKSRPASFLHPHDLSVVDIILSIPNLTDQETYKLLSILSSHHFLVPWVVALLNPGSTDQMQEVIE